MALFKYMVLAGCLLFVNPSLALGQPTLKVVKISEKDCGTTINVPVGGQVELMLEGNPTTGYTWEATGYDAAVLQLLEGQEYRPDQPLLGAPGKLLFHLKALKPGTTQLEMIYHRPFEHDTPPIKSCTLAVIVDQ